MRDSSWIAVALLAGCGTNPVQPPASSVPRSMPAVSKAEKRSPDQSPATAVAGTRDNVRFVFPFPDDVAAWTIEGNNQRPTHEDEMNRYAFDFDVPEGTPVCAAADGIVIYVQQTNDHATGYWQENNEVALRHRDGTYTIYLHLRKGSARVVGGQAVHAGDVIAQSGNTGKSSGPHLHFCRLSDWERGPSIPCSFVDVAGDGVPQTGQRVGAKVDRVRSISQRLPP